MTSKSAQAQGKQRAASLPLVFRLGACFGPATDSVCADHIRNVPHERELPECVFRAIVTGDFAKA